MMCQGPSFTKEFVSSHTLARSRDQNHPRAKATPVQTRVRVQGLPGIDKRAVVWGGFGCCPLVT